MNEEKQDRFARGECSPEESRDLAQAALDDPGLFEDLTAIALASTVRPRSHPKRLLQPRMIAWAAAAAVVIALLPVYLLRLGKTTPAPVAAPPVFLATAGADATVFRGADSESRAPRAAGSVISMTDGFATIDLGSLDGLSKGAEVEILRDGRTVGNLKLETIFRERSRAQGAVVQLHDQIRVPAATHIRALLDQIEALTSRGDSASARRLAEQDTNAALDVTLESFADLNNLGVIAELRGDHARARSLYEGALRANPPDAARRSIEANLARVKGAN